ncbi:hypothetical protein LTR16_000991 [Cryomyces antarcticus]|uniref:Acyltransferase 3 domain-containing protein n=1 Tax=Cryomyces antarcticus TaxID=329879 RepID=A0ABR0LZU7_9PEZI|nr:hypothetical protein LTR16_000991 [Cryomyces antarcticus]
MRTLLSDLVINRPSSDSYQDYLLGLRGLLVLESFLWIFLQTFVPAVVKGADSTTGPTYQVILRKTLSVLFWNENLLYSFFIILSARTICISFIARSTKTEVAGAVFRRALRLWFPVALSLAITYAIFSATGIAYIDEYKRISGNSSFETPYQIPNALAYLNSVFDVFWITHSFATQAANYAFPSQTLWVISVIFLQSYTVYMTMIIIPYTKHAWRMQAYFCFVITAWWVQSWAWYSVTGLLLADMVMNMDFKAKSRRGIHVWRKLRCPGWVPATVLMFAGLTMQYLWTAWKPEYRNAELVAHTAIYSSSGGLNRDYDVRQPQARIDCYLIVLGFCLILESFDFLQTVFKTPFLVSLGKRSLSWFLVQGIVIYTAGIKLWLHLHNTQACSDGTAVLICLVVSLAGVALGAEVFYRLVDTPSRLLAHRMFHWIRE